MCSPTVADSVGGGGPGPGAALGGPLLEETEDPQREECGKARCTGLFEAHLPCLGSAGWGLSPAQPGVGLAGAPHCPEPAGREVPLLRLIAWRQLVALMGALSSLWGPMS